MRPLIVPLSAAFVVAAAPAAPAKPRAIPFEQLVARADVIARVRVESVAPNPAAAWSGSRQARPLRQTARLRLREVLKGPVFAGQSVRIGFDNGAACPNVWYRPGEECLIFLERRRDGTLATLNYTNGKKLLGPAARAEGTLPGESPYAVWKRRIRVAMTRDVATP